MISLNLLPDVKKEYLKTQRLKHTIIALSVAVAVLAAIFLAITGSILLAQTANKNGIRADIKKNYDIIVSEKDGDTARINRLLTIQEDIDSINSISSDSPVISRVFDFLKQVNASEPNNAEIDRIVITASGKNVSATINGVVSSFAALDTYKESLKTAKFVSAENPSQEEAELLFDDVKVISSSFSSQRNRVSFRVTLEFNSEAFSLTTRKDGKTVLMTKVLAFVPNQTVSNAAKNIPVFSQSDAELIEAEEVTPAATEQEGSNE